jgi:hypothetical protein
MSNACTCTISIENQRGKDTNYSILMDPNQFSGDGKPLMNTWWSSSIPNGTTSEVPMGTGLYGCKQPYKHPHQLNSQVSPLFTVGSNNQSLSSFEVAKVVANDIRPGIPLMNGRGTSRPAGLGIHSDLSSMLHIFHLQERFNRSTLGMYRTS